MVRPLRIQYPGAVYHVTTRGNERKAIFQDEQDRETFLRTLHHVIDRYHWVCDAYCLMNNHYHLLVETPDGNLSKGMRQLNGVYTQLFNRRHRRIGHLFQGRYKAILIQKDSHLLEASRYVVLNPVRAGTVKRPDQWKWSSYLATAGKGKPHPCLTTEWIIQQFSSERAAGERAYRQFVREGISAGTIWENVRVQSILGGEDFIEGLEEYLRGNKNIPEIAKSQRYMNRPTLQKLFNGEVIRDKRKRDKKIVEAVEDFGYSQKEVADNLGMHFSSISRIMRRK
jgi:putative transposase